MMQHMLWTRRTALQALGGIGAAGAAAILCGSSQAKETTKVKWSSGTERPKHKAPRHATDCHHHIFDSRFPLAKNPSMLLGGDGNATVDDYQLLQRRLGIERHVVVHAAGAYGTDIEFADAFPQESAVNLISDKSNIIATRTFSKLFGLANLRVGYAVGPEAAISAMFKVKPKWNVGMVAQNAAEAALGDMEHFALTRKVVKEGRDYFMRELSRIPGIEMVSDPQGNFVMAKVVGARFTAEAITEALTRRGIIIRGDFHPDYVRISVGTMPENEALIKNLKELVEQGRARAKAQV